MGRELLKAIGRMRVLFTNNTLDLRAGSELYVRDIALALLGRGHEPIAYSRRLGDVARELRRATIPVLDDLERLEQPPELIHAQHHLEAMTALARFPETPAVYVCHGWLPDEEAPPSHPNILRYVAVDELVRQRLLDECAIPSRRVVTLLNFVDLERFRERPPLPRKPSRALVFSNELAEVDGLDEIRRACDSRGIQLEVVGRRAGTLTATPEEILGSYDIVLAKGRAAMEAAAVGCAVVLCDRSGLGPMVGSSDFDRIRSFNFGVRLLQERLTEETVSRQLESYDADDAARVTRRMRAEAGLGDAVERLLDLYLEVATEYGETVHDPGKRALALHRYLRRGPLTGGDLFQQERDAYRLELSRAEDYVHSLLEHLEATRAEVRAREEKIAALELENARLSRVLQDLKKAPRLGAEEVETLKRETESLKDELRWMTASATWRAREALLDSAFVRGLYRTLRRRS